MVDHEGLDVVVDEFYLHLEGVGVSGVDGDGVFTFLVHLELPVLGVAEAYDGLVLVGVVGLIHDAGPPVAVVLKQELELGVTIEVTGPGEGAAALLHWLGLVLGPAVRSAVTDGIDVLDGILLLANGNFNYIGEHSLNVLVVLCGNADAGDEVEAIIDGSAYLGGKGREFGVAELLLGGRALECGSGSELAVAFLGDLEAVDGGDAFC